MHKKDGSRHFLPAHPHLYFMTSPLIPINLENEYQRIQQQELIFIYLKITCFSFRKIILSL